MYYPHFCIAALTTVAKAYNITWSGFSQQKSQLNRFELKSVLLGLAKLRKEYDLIYPNNFLPRLLCFHTGLFAEERCLFVAYSS